MSDYFRIGSDPHTLHRKINVITRSVYTSRVDDVLLRECESFVECRSEGIMFALPSRQKPGRD